MEFPAYTREALLQADWRGLMAIVEYRRVKTAIDLFNSGRDGAEQLGKRPDLTALLLEMAKAQDADTELDHVYHTLKSQRTDSDDDEEDDD